ncbi:MAG: alpha/beta hydrolase [Devosia nanyangense]|uniref:Alpha/beta hydrolase n=1 Tax=Devosia nanyangense TaxID=1228055 RepID=A0A933L5B3_9HYPH|nr:alpha/beta hydrolase [Devosia nanyangense]
MASSEGNLAGLHPFLAAGVAVRRRGPHYSDLTLIEARKLSRARQGDPTRLPAVDAVDDFSIPGPAGPLPVRLYRPSPGPALPLVVYFHGGGFVAGDLDSHDSILRRLALASGGLVLSVAYRLAPEHPFPAAIEDAEAALQHTLAHAGVLGADPRAVFAGGDSAGAAIAFAAAGVVPGLAGMLLFYPVTDLSRLGETESYRRFGDGAAGLSLDDMQWSARHYAPEGTSRQDWRCSPLLVGERVGLPPAFVATAEYDVLRSEGEALANLLAARGNSVEHHAVQGVNHGYLGAGDAVPQAAATIAAAAAWIRTLVHSAGDDGARPVR